MGDRFFVTIFGFWMFLDWPQEWIDNSRNNGVVAIFVEGKLMETPITGTSTMTVLVEI